METAGPELLLPVGHTVPTCCQRSRLPPSWAELPPLLVLPHLLSHRRVQAALGHITASAPTLLLPPRPASVSFPLLSAKCNSPLPQGPN